MKIIRVANFGRDYIPDVLVCENINKVEGESIVRMFNDEEGETSPHFYRLVADEYKLLTVEDVYG